MAAAGEESQSQGSRNPTHSTPTLMALQHSFTALGSNLRLFVCFLKTASISLTQLGEFGSSEEAQLGGSGPGPREVGVNMIAGDRPAKAGLGWRT